DEEGLKAAENAFEAQCKVDCLRLAAEATEIDPANVDWWRLRALLLWRYSMHSYDDSPRSENWLEILREASEHDADNALYDYMAAYFYWESSAEMDFHGDDDRLVVQDQERFNRGVAHFEQGQKKPLFEVGDAGFSAVAEFLSKTAIPISDHEKIVNSRLIHIRRSVLLRSVWRWQGLRASEAAANEDVRMALAMERSNLHMINQFTSGASTRYDNIAIACRVSTTYQMNTLVIEHRELFSKAEVEDVRALEENAQVAVKVARQAAQELAKNRPPQQSGTIFTGSPATLISATVFGVSPSLVVVLILAGVLAFGLSRIGSDRELPTVGVIGHSLSLASAFMFTVVVFGLAAARIIAPAIQAWVFTIFVIISPLVFVSWIIWTWLRRRAFKFSLRDMFLCVLICGVLFGIVAMVRPGAESFAQLPFDVSVPARGWNDLDAQSLENVLRPRGIWLWALLQWIAYHGQNMTLGVWATFVAALLRFKLRGVQLKTGTAPITFRNFIGVWARSLGCVCLTLSTLATILYLSVAPAGIAEVERDFQEKMAYTRQPGDHWSEVEQAVFRVQSNQELMRELRATVRTEIAEERASESEE
ncbi:MAG: hypothetical protein NXI22_02520, partial [bacterium]|nr:hypothetical protein [bacterium]